MVLHRNLTAISLYSSHEAGDALPHNNCDFTAEMSVKLDKVYNAEFSEVSDQELLHMKKQWAKGHSTP